MILHGLGPAHQEDVMALFCRAFQEDAYYAALLPDPATREADMRRFFSEPLKYCLQGETSLGLWEEEQLIGFLLCFDYQQARRQPDVFNSLFGSDQPGARFPRHAALFERMEAVPEKAMYLLSVAVQPAFRQKGLAEAMLDAFLQRFPQWHLMSDVSNPATLGMYRKRNFTVEEIGEQYFFVHYDPALPPQTAVFGDTMRVLVPQTDFLRAFGDIAFTVRRDCRCLADGEIRTSCGVPYFFRQPGSVCPAVEIDLPYEEFLKYQRIINPSQCDEAMLGDAVLYWNIQPYEVEPLLNDTLRDMLPNRQTEWSVIPDLFVSIPMRYRDIRLLEDQKEEDDLEAAQLLKSMDFRTQFELGLPVSEADVDDYSGFKKRLKRIYLGKFQLQVTGEILIGQETEDGPDIGPRAFVDMFVTADTQSNCAVLTWYSLSSPFLISHLLDCISRSQLHILHAGKKENFYSFLSREYGMIKEGKPKSALIIPRPPSCLEPTQLASLLAGETIYPDGEAYGILNDQEILSAASADHSLGQYDRGYLYAYTTVVVQFSPGFCASIQDRLREESILMFYMELILLEEASIHIANQAMIRLLSDETLEEPVAFLEQVSKIYDDYCKTTDFWSIQANYPSSQRSMDVLRKAFRIQDQLENMQRSQAQLQSVFDVKSDRIDRRESRRMDTSLALISFLAIFSAWIDGHDYIGTWEEELGAGNVHIFQRMLFAVILLIAVFAISHLLGSKIRGFWQKKRGNRKAKSTTGKEKKH